MQIQSAIKVGKPFRPQASTTGLLALVALLVQFAAPALFAAGPYYWDNVAGAGFGTAGGTWSPTTAGPTPGWNTDSTGTASPASVTTDTSDTSENFGSATAGLAAGTVTVSGTVNSGPINFVSGSGAITLSGGTITLPAVATITVSNASDAISSILAGAGTSLTCVGSNTSTLTLGGANSYGGGTLLAGPKVTLTTAASIPSGSVVTITTGAQLFCNIASATLANNFTISGMGNLDANGVNVGAIRLVNGDALSGTITLAANSRIGGNLTSAGNISSTLSGQITGGFGLDFYGWFNGVAGSQAFILANTGTPNDYSGTTAVYNNYSNGSSSAGDNTIVKLGASEQIPNGPGKGIVTLNGYTANRLCTFELNGFNETVNGIANSTAGQLFNVIQNTATGASTLTVGDANTNSAFGGNILDGGAGKTLALIKIGAGTLALSGSNAFSGGVTVSNGTLEADSANALGSGMLVINGGALSNNFSATLTNNINLAAAATVGVGASQTLTLGGVITNSGSLTVQGAGTLSLTNANNYSGGTFVIGGNVGPRNSFCFGSGTVTVNPNGAVFNISATSLTFTNAVTLNGGQLHTGGGISGTKNTWAGPVTLTASSSVASDGGTTGNTFTGGLNIGNSGYTFTVGGNGNGSGTDNNFNSVISGGPNATFVTTIAGVAHLNAANTYSGTNRSGFSLVLQNVNAMQNATLDMNAADSGTVTLVNNAVIGALTGSRNLNLGGFAASIGNNNASTTFSGALTNSGSLSKIGSGTLTLSGANTYAGRTTVSAGTLALSGSGSLASTNITVAGGATLDVSAAGFTLVSGQVLSNSASATASLVGPLNSGSGTISASFVNGTPSFDVGGGALNLSAATIVLVRNTGATLTPGTYKIISKSGSGAVVGTAPTSVSVANGPSAGTPFVSIVGGELYLTVGGTSSIVYTGTGPFTYNGVAQGPTVNVNGSTSAQTVTYAGVSVSYGPSIMAPTNAGTYYLSNTVATDANYFGATNSQSFTIDAASLSVTANNDTKTYGQTTTYGAGSTAFTSSGLPHGETIGSVTIAASGGTAATDAPGSYNLVASAATGGTFSSANYTISYTNGTLTVNPASLLVQADNASRAYGATNSVFTLSYSGFVNSQTLGTSDVSGAPSLTSTADTNSPVGTYDIVAALGSLTATNYSFVFSNGTLTVAQAAITVTADNQTRQYGATNPAATASYSGFVNGDTILVISGSPLLTTTADTNSPVGSYTITAAQGSLNATNYAFTLVDGTLTVTTTPLGVTANNDSKTYDGLGYTGGNGVVYSGFVNGETSAVLGGTLSYGGSSQGATNSGTYTIEPSGLTSSNYAISETNGTLVINPLSVTVMADPQTKVYGMSDPALTYTVTPELISGDHFSGGLSRASGENVGSYAINQSTLALSVNYTLNYTGANLGITPAALSITANNASKNYGQTVTFAGTEITTSGLQLGDSVTGVTLRSAGATNTAAVNTYPIAVSEAFGTGLSNYTISYTNGTLTVNAATPVVISATVLLPDGNFRLSFTGGDAGVNYKIQASEDLGNPVWSLLATMSGLTNYIDLDATNHPNRFYRTMVP